VFSPIVKADDSGWTDAGTVATGAGMVLSGRFLAKQKHRMILTPELL